MYRLLFSLLLPWVWVSASLAQPASGCRQLELQLREYLSTRRAQVGVALIVDGRDTLAVNNHVCYPMMSVFKFHQALAVADYLQRNRLPLTTMIFVRKEDLPSGTYSPLRDKYPEGNVDLSVADLLTYTLQLSDNNACDILFDRTASIGQTETYIRSLGLRDCSIGATEADMHRDQRLCYRNCTSPLDAARLLDLFLTRPLLSEPYHSFVKETMLTCRTGQDRIVKPLLGKELLVGHKTGTGDRDASGRLTGINDIGFVLFPDGRRYTLAVFVTGSEEGMAETAGIIAAISEMVYLSLSSRTTRQ